MSWRVKRYILSTVKSDFLLEISERVRRRFDTPDLLGHDSHHELMDAGREEERDEHG